MGSNPATPTILFIELVIFALWGFFVAPQGATSLTFNKLDHLCWLAVLGLRGLLLIQQHPRLQHQYAADHAQHDAHGAALIDADPQHEGAEAEVADMPVQFHGLALFPMRRTEPL